MRNSVHRSHQADSKLDDSEGRPHRRSASPRALPSAESARLRPIGGHCQRPAVAPSARSDFVAQGPACPVVVRRQPAQAGSGRSMRSTPHVGRYLAAKISVDRQRSARSPPLVIDWCVSARARKIERSDAATARPSRSCGVGAPRVTDKGPGGVPRLRSARGTGPSLLTRSTGASFRVVALSTGR